jgi:hypothetical protein
MVAFKYKNEIGIEPDKKGKCLFNPIQGLFISIASLRNGAMMLSIAKKTWIYLFIF